MKCPSLVSHSLRSPSSDDISSPVAKVIVSVDPNLPDLSPLQVIDNDNGTHMRPMPGMMTTSFSVHQEKKKPPAKASDTKRTRRDRGEMEDIMFKLFERQPNWTLRQLIQETDQPELFLKDILKELCVYNNKGSNQGSYELKPEYKKSSEDPATSK
ncbi:General transcription factor IIF subunit 2 [Linum perenne]